MVKSKPLSTQAMPTLRQDFIEAIRMGLMVMGMVVGLAILFHSIFRPVIESLSVEETVTEILGRLLLVILPYLTYLATSSVGRRHVGKNNQRAILVGVISSLLMFAIITFGHLATGQGVFAPRPSLEAILSQVDEGILIESVVPEGVMAQAGLQTGDIITAIRRDDVDLAGLNQRVEQAEVDDPLRLRFLREGEEMQETVRVTLSTMRDFSMVLPGVVIAIAFTLLVMYVPGRFAPYIVLFLLLLPLLVGYLWLIIATFSFRTEGLLPLDGNDNIGGLTLENWEALFSGNIEGFRFDIVPILGASFGIAILMTIIVLLVSSMAGYALSRMSFPGRKFFLSFTLILHGFPAVTLIIPIFFVLLNLGNLPLIGDLVGFNTIGGIALVMVAFELPLGIWLMKGFFDNIPWDMERSALIDGASRFRTYWEILLPQIRPGLLALGIFAFIGGWNAYIIPATYSIGSGVNNLPVFLNELTAETAPVDWNQVATVGLFQLIPIFIFFVFAQEYLLNIYAGGTKGSS